MGSQLKKGEISQSTQNRIDYVDKGLFVFSAMLKANTDAKGNLKGTKKKISKRDLCTYMAQHNKVFRLIWLRTHPNKKFPKAMPERIEMGLAFYASNVKDMRRFVRIDSIEKEMKRLTKKDTTWRYFEKGKVKKFKV